MSVERDLKLEMQLRRIEERIAIDPILSIMIQMEQDHDLILSRIRETYFSDFLQKYQIQITICEPGDVLAVAGLPRPVSCYQYFHSEILKNGTPGRRFQVLQYGQQTGNGQLHWRFYILQLQRIPGSIYST